MKKSTPTGSVLIAVTFLFVLPLLAAEHYTPQPAGKHSSLVGNDKKQLLDEEFARLIGGLLIKDGQKNAKDAKFLFQQCYGGGMLDDLDRMIGDKLPWIGGAAARHDQVSYGTINNLNDLDAWTKALLPPLRD